MSDLDRVANATLFTDQNKDLLAKMLEKALLQPLVPMEPAAAQKYMERVAVRTATDNQTDIELFQTVQMSSSESTYVMRVALFGNTRPLVWTLWTQKTASSSSPNPARYASSPSQRSTDHHVKERITFATLVGLVAYAAIATDLYLPAIPALVAEFGATASGGQITLSVFMLGIAVGQLLFEVLDLP